METITGMQEKRLETINKGLEFLISFLDEIKIIY